MGVISIMKIAKDLGFVRLNGLPEFIDMNRSTVYCCNIITAATQIGIDGTHHDHDADDN
ncbi:hypothetical protein J23TS9_54360 [Paenibacillus sp. J23TS9]|nr:hypothetical protein J23TS9_54360 [Paenibacillus sp. J23TS9]